MSPLKLKRRYVEKIFTFFIIPPPPLESCSNFFEGLLYLGIFSLQGVIDLRQQSICITTIRVFLFYVFFSLSLQTSSLLLDQSAAFPMF